MKRNLCKKCTEQMLRREVFAAFAALGNRVITTSTTSQDAKDKTFCEFCGCKLQDEDTTIK